METMICFRWSAFHSVWFDLTTTGKTIACKIQRAVGDAFNTRFATIMQGNDTAMPSSEQRAVVQCSRMRLNRLIL